MTDLRRLFGVRPTRESLVAKREHLDRARLYAYLGPEEAMTQIHDRQFIYLDPADEQVAAQIIARGYWEVWIEEAIGRMLIKGARVVEVGANVGYYTLLMARKVGPTGRIDSFEANPRLANLLRKSLTLNGWNDRVRLHVKAAANATGPLTFATSRKAAGGGHIAVQGEVLSPGVETYTVEGVRLDDVIEAGPIDLLRLDAEGSEGVILDGAAGLIARSPDLKIVMEWDRVQLAARTDVASMIEALEVTGFRFWRIEFDATLTSVGREQLLAMPHSDIVAARRQPF